MVFTQNERYVRREVLSFVIRKQNAIFLLLFSWIVKDLGLNAPNTKVIKLPILRHLNIGIDQK